MCRPWWDTYAQKVMNDTVCPWPWYTMTVNWDGGVAPCCRTTGDKWDLGNVKQASVEAIWRGENYRRLREIVATQQVPPGYEHIVCASCKEFRAPEPKVRRQPAEAVAAS